MHLRIYFVICKNLFDLKIWKKCNAFIEVQITMKNVLHFKAVVLKLVGGTEPNKFHAGTHQSLP